MKTALLPPLSSNTNKNSSLLPRRPSTSNASLSSRSPSSNSRGIRLPPHSSSTATISTPSRQSSLKIKDPSPRVVEPAPIYHEPILLLEHYKIFWRIHQTALISIYFHLDCDFFEVIAYFVDKLREERLYVSNKSIIPIFENTSEMQMVKFLRWDLLDRSLRKCAAEYIFGIIDSDSFGYLCLTKYAGEVLR